MKMTIYTADCRGNEKNNRYPNKRIVVDAESLLKAVAQDHVCAEYEGHHRMKLNFLMADVCVMDLDNDHSENPDDWVTPETMREALYREVYE